MRTLLISTPRLEIFLMASEDQDQWLVEHIPHRLRACLPFLTLQEELMPDTADEKARQNITGFCLVTAALEGRMVALRWLIEFVGIRERKGKPARPRCAQIDSVVASSQRVNASVLP
jgi:hypothetical protein